MKARLLLRSALAAVAALVLVPGAALAEDPGGDGGTVNVGPVSKGPVVSQGSAGYDPNGITATASTQPTGSGTTSTAPSYVYRPIPGNSVPASCPTTQSNGVVSNPCAQLPVSACPPAQTGYYVYDSNGNALARRSDRLLRLRLQRQCPRPPLRPQPDRQPASSDNSGNRTCGRRELAAAMASSEAGDQSKRWPDRLAFMVLAQRKRIDARRCRVFRPAHCAGARPAGGHQLGVRRRPGL